MEELERLRVLLVEDNALDARAWQRMLAQTPDTRFEVRLATDLATALQLLADEAFDCVLLDLSLPDSQGLLAVDTISARAPHAPIVVLTGLDDPKTALQAVNRGAHDYLQKGHVDGELVARSIRYAVARHHAEVSLRSTNEQLEIARDRGRIARDLHDTVVQQLFATGMGLHALAGTMTDAAAQATLVSAVDQIDLAIRQLREAIFDLHIEAAEREERSELDEAIRSQGLALGFQPSVVTRNLDDLDGDVFGEVIAVVREALANVAKHAEATSAEVALSIDDRWIVVEVTDNGRGAPDRPLAGGNGLTGHGLGNMSARAVALGGTFSIRPGPGGGTQVVWRVPNQATD